MKVIFRNATEDDVRGFYTKPPGFTLRAIVAVLDDKVIAIAGTYRAGDYIYGFSEMREAMRPRKKDILRMVKLAMPLVYRHTQVVAYANGQEPTACSFLVKLGFEHIGSSEDGEVFLWKQSQQSEAQ